MDDVRRVGRSSARARAHIRDEHLAAKNAKSFERLHGIVWTNQHQHQRIWRNGKSPVCTRRRRRPFNPASRRLRVVVPRDGRVERGAVECKTTPAGESVPKWMRFGTRRPGCAGRRVHHEKGNACINPSGAFSRLKWRMLCLLCVPIKMQGVSKPPNQHIN